MQLVRSLPLRLLILLTVTTTAVAQPRADRRAPAATSLLWRISGNGLTRPSYLYGTMHVEHKDVFAFGDSVLAKLQECAAFATESHLDSLARASLMYYFERDAAENTVEGEEDLEMSEESDESGTKGEWGGTRRGAGFPTPSRDVWPRRMSFRGSDDPDTDGPVFLDAWLFNLAKDLDKHLLGVETIEEQFALIEDNDMQEFDPTGINIFAAIRAQRDLIRYYKEGKVDKLEDLLRETIPQAQFEKLLTRRNHIMAERITQQIALEQTFIAVGAGHLGGDEGVISLLRSRGFTVTPIPATYTGVANRFKRPDKRRPWLTFNHDEGAFSVDIPVVPVQYPIDTVAIDSSNGRLQPVHYWVSPDIGGGLYYSFSYTDYASWIPVSNSETTLDAAVAHYLTSFEGTVVRDDPFVVFGFPGRDIEVSTDDQSGYRLRLCLRGRRLYSLMVNGSKRLIRGDTPDQFLGSFIIKDPIPVNWQRFVSEEEGFGVEVPGTPIISLDTLYYRANMVVRSFISADRNSGRSYSLQAAHYSEYYQSESPEAFFDRLKKLRTNQNELVLHDSAIMVDGFRGNDLVIVDTSNGSTSHVRAVLRGTVLYELWSNALNATADSNDIAHFIASFHLLERPVVGNLFSSKVDLLFDDLESDDPAQHLLARNELMGFPFTESDLPRLYKAIRRDWPAGEEGWGLQFTTKHLLIRSLGTVKSERPIPFLRDLYTETDSDQVELRSTILRTLAGISTVASREAALDLLLHSKERGEKTAFNLYELYDSLPSGSHLFPRILELVNFPDHRFEVIWIARTMIDSGIVAPEIIRTANTLEACRDAIRTYRKPTKVNEFMKEFTESEPYEAAAAIRLLEVITDDEETMRLVASLLDDKATSVVVSATTALLRHGQPVPQSTLERVAADSVYCLDLYRALTTLNRLDLFPETWLTQRHFAECLLVEWLLNDDETTPEEIRYVAQKDLVVEGDSIRVFLFKFRLEDEWYVGMAGPQPFDRKKVAASGTMTGSVYRTYDDLSIKEHFSLLLKELD